MTPMIDLRPRIRQPFLDRNNILDFASLARILDKAEAFYIDGLFCQRAYTSKDKDYIHICAYHIESGSHFNYHWRPEDLEGIVVNNNSNIVIYKSRGEDEGHIICPLVKMKL